MAKNELDLTTDGDFRKKANAVLAEVAGRGFRPYYASTKRTVQEQRVKVALGYSQTMHSKHVLRGADGGCLAADVVDQRWGWGDKSLSSDELKEVRRFWLTLGRCALLHGLGWGGLWFRGIAKLTTAPRLRRFLMDQTRPFNPDNWQGPLGWDPAHIEKQ